MLLVIALYVEVLAACNTPVRAATDIGHRADLLEA